MREKRRTRKERTGKRETRGAKGWKKKRRTATVEEMERREQKQAEKEKEKEKEKRKRKEMKKSYLGQSSRSSSLSPLLIALFFCFHLPHDQNGLVFLVYCLHTSRYFGKQQKKVNQEDFSQGKATSSQSKIETSTDKERKKMTACTSSFLLHLLVVVLALAPREFKKTHIVSVKHSLLINTRNQSIITKRLWNHGKDPKMAHESSLKRHMKKRNWKKKMKTDTRHVRVSMFGNNSSGGTQRYTGVISKWINCSDSRKSRRREC